MANITIVYHSGYGHTKKLAEHVLKGASAVAGVKASLITSDDAIKDMTPLNQADAIIFGCPTYMGGPSAKFKEFIDAASKVWFSQGWKDKLAAGFTNSGSPSGDKLQTLQSLWINAMQHSMIWVSLGVTADTADPGNVKSLNRLSSYSGVMAQSPHQAPDPYPGDLATGELLGKRVAEAALRWTKGRG